MKRIKQTSANVHFPKFAGQINVSNDTIKFGKSAIIFWDTDPEIMKIFELGLVFPDLINSTFPMYKKYEYHESSVADTIYISNVMELHFLFQKPNRKCFRFLIWDRDWKERYRNLNPALYLFELKNNNIKSMNDLKTFIEKSKVTAFGFCSILI
jgi:hypothetical protein